MHPSHRRRCAGAVAAILLAALPAHARPSLAQSLEEFESDYLDTPTDGPDLSQAESLIVEETNKLRQEHGISKVETNSQLAQTARYFAAFMARTNEYGHKADGNRPSQRASLFEYEYCIVSENIAKLFDSTGFQTQELGQQFYEGWRDSPGHRKNMLDEFVTETGVAIAFNPDTGWYYGVQMFGRPRSQSQRFQIANRTDRSLNYSLGVEGNVASAAKAFDLPPMSSRTHVRCRPASIDWQWTEEADELRAESGTAFVINAEPSGYVITREQLKSSIGRRNESE